MNATLKEAKTKQPALLDHFMHVIRDGQLTHAYLFSGEAGVGKLATALTIAMRLFCSHVQDNYPCGTCNECQRISAPSHPHPDVAVIKPQGQTIRIHQIRFLKAEFSKSAVEGNLKVFIIVDAEKMTESAANSLLKFIEEPAGNVVSFLLTTNRAAILPTIVSRTQVVEFPSLAPQAFFRELKRVQINPSSYRLIAAMTNSLRTAERWNQNQWFGRLQTGVAQWFHQVINRRLDAFPLVQIDLMPLIRQRNDQQVALEMLVQIWCDVMKVKFVRLSPRLLKFPKAARDVKQVADQISTPNLLKIIELMLANDQLWSLNVNFQNILERTTLKVLTILK